MAQIQVDINDTLRAHIDHVVSTGHYGSVAEVVRAGLRKLLIAERALQIDPKVFLQDAGMAVPQGPVQGTTRLRPAREPKVPKESMAVVAARLKDNQAAHDTEYRKCSHWKDGCTICSARFGRAPGAPDLGPPPAGTVVRPRTGADA